MRIPRGRWFQSQTRASDASASPSPWTEGPILPSFLQPPPIRPEEELDRLTKKLVYDMNNPPSGEYFGEAFFWNDFSAWGGCHC